MLLYVATAAPGGILLGSVFAFVLVLLLCCSGFNERGEVKYKRHDDGAEKYDDMVRFRSPLLYLPTNQLPTTN